MTRSGISLLTRSASQIVTTALRRARIIPVRQPISDTDLQNGIDALNDFVAELRTQGWHLWKQKELVLFLEQGKQSYFLGESGDRSVFLDDLIQAEVLVNTPALSNTISISDTSEFVGADDILSFNPTTSTADWTTVDATLVFSGVDTLTLTNTGVDGNTSYIAIETTPQQNYFFQVNFTSISTTSRIEVFSGASTTLLASTDFPTGTTDAVVFFTATEATSFIRITAVGAIAESAVFDSVRLRDVATGEELGFRVNAGVREWGVVTRVIDGNVLALFNPTVNESVASESVFAFKQRPPRPMKLRNYRSKNAKFDDEIPVTTWTRQEYFKQTNKGSQGLPTQAYYNPTLDNGRLYVWQTANDVDQLLLFTADLPIEIFVENANDPDFPAEWFNMLAWNLASQLGPQYGIPGNRQQVLDLKATQSKEDALDWDEESGSLFATPDGR
jgi:hypothetical protein